VPDLPNHLSKNFRLGWSWTVIFSWKPTIGCWLVVRQEKNLYIYKTGLLLHFLQKGPTAWEDAQKKFMLARKVAMAPHFSLRIPFFCDCIYLLNAFHPLH
jgi:hypothetical protein